MLSVRNLTKIYKIKGRGVKQVVALNNVSIDFPETGMVFLLGKSGSGKSTLLNSIGGLDTFNSGEILIKGKSSKDFKQSDFDAYRNTFIGFIFQEYNILEEFSIGKNLALALELQGKKADTYAVNNLLDKVDLSGYYRRKPNQLSGGQKQRVAIARALIKDPEIIMADEPTGALDSNTGKQVMDTLKKLSKEKLVIVVSHDREFAEIYGDRVIELRDGKIISDTTKHEVAADRSIAGVSLIDNKIIHIKKGQKLSNEDLIKIDQMIIDNANYQDTIISFDEKPNREIKKAAFITEDGNREVFKKTTKEDVPLKTYNPDQFKLIRSKMRLKDAFKMGASSLKHKPIRLFFTILLSFIAFAMFGLTDTMASYNVATSTYESIKMMNVKTLAFSGAETDSYGYKNTSGMTQGFVQHIENKYNDYSFYKVVNAKKNYYLDGASSQSSSGSYNLFYEKYISGVLPLNNDIRQNLNLTLEGNYPTTDDEVVISKHIFDCLKRDYQNIATLADLSSKTFSCDGYNLKIVGIVTDDTDVSKYEDNSINGVNNMQDYMNYAEIQTVVGYGLVNMCYVSQDAYNHLVDNNKISREFGDCYLGSEKTDYAPSAYSSYFENINQQIASNANYETEHIRYKKTGIDLANLQNNQIVIGSNCNVMNYYTGDTSDLQALLDNGLTLTIENRKGDKLYTFNVVAFSDEYDDYSVSDYQYKQMFAGYDYIVTRLKNNNNDFALINELVNYDVNGTGYEIQFQATSMLNSFANMIVGMGQTFLYIGIGFAVFAGFMLMNFISTSIAYKKREIGVLRAIGAGKKDVFSIFFSESFVIAIINFVLATIATFVAAYFINRSLYENIGFTITLLTVGIRQIILLLAVSIGVAFISTLLPVYRIARKNPIDSINNR